MQECLFLCIQVPSVRLCVVRALEYRTGSQSIRSTRSNRACRSCRPRERSQDSGGRSGTLSPLKVCFVFIFYRRVYSLWLTRGSVRRGQHTFQPDNKENKVRLLEWFLDLNVIPPLDPFKGSSRCAILFPFSLLLFFFCFSYSPQGCYWTIVKSSLSTFFKIHL